MPGTTVLYGFGPSRIEKGYYTGLNINSTAASRTAITTGMGTGQNVGYLGVGDVLVRDPNGQDQGLGRDFTQPQTSYLYEQAVVVVELLNPKTMGSQTFKDGSGTQYYPQEFNYIELNPDISALTKANMTAGTTVLGLANASSALQAVSGMTLTDSTGGTAGTTLAAVAVQNTVTIGPFSMALLVNSQVFAVPIPYAFTITGTPNLRIPIAITTGAKAATFTTGIDGVACTGGVISASGAKATNTSHAASAAVTAGGTGTAGQTITSTVSSVTAYAEGYGILEFTVINNSLANTISSLAANIGLQQRVKALALETVNTATTAALKRVKFGGPFQHNSA